MNGFISQEIKQVTQPICQCENIEICNEFFIEFFGITLVNKIT